MLCSRDQAQLSTHGICEETNTGDDTGTDVVPAERSLVDLGESKSPALIRVGNVGKVIVEVVEGCVATGRLVGLGRTGIEYSSRHFGGWCCCYLFLALQIKSARDARAAVWAFRDELPVGILGD
jgi:hypothetical protein